MKTLLVRLNAEAKQARTGDGRAYVVKLLRRPDGDDTGAYEILARSLPIDLLNIPELKAAAELLGSEAFEQPWLIVLHDDGVTVVPLDRFTPNWRMYGGS